MTISDWLTIAAIFLAPFFAVNVQRRLEDRRGKTDRRKYIFQTLMATRATRAAPEHVYALNSIDIEFKGVQRVEEAWHDYLDHLVNPAPEDDQNAIAAWNSTFDNLFSDLLYEMSHSLGYKFEKNYLRRGVYRPQAHFVEDQFQQGIRYGLAQLFANRYALPVRLVDAAASTSPEGGEEIEAPDTGTPDSDQSS